MARKGSTIAAPDEHQLLLRLVVVDPPPDVLFALQRGSSELVGAVRSTGATLTFDFDVRARREEGGASLRLLGPFTQGPPAARFVYLNSGSYSGESNTCWSRRAKIPLTGLTADHLDRVLAQPGSRLQVQFAGKSRDGGPVCASVKLSDPGWTIVDEE
jgi:hypothetical protein